MPTFSPSLEKALHQALTFANERHHEYATLEHLLLALIDDADAAAVMGACNVDLDALRKTLVEYVDNELSNLITGYDEDSKPTSGFQRVIQRAVIHVQSSGREEVTGANVLVAIFAERESHAAYFLQEQESQMGTRHPRLQAARSSLQSISVEIRGELQRLATSARGEYEQAKAAEDSIAKELAVQKALHASSSDKQVELNELQRKATAARDIYETVLKRSSQTSEEQNLNQSNIRVISPAEPPVKADGPGKKILLVAGIIGGFLAGFVVGAGFAILAGLFGHPVIRSYFRKSSAAAA